jgi:hypothetical protein
VLHQEVPFPVVARRSFGDERQRLPAKLVAELVIGRPLAPLHGPVEARQQLEAGIADAAEPTVLCSAITYNLYGNDFAPESRKLFCQADTLEGGL